MAQVIDLAQYWQGKNGGSTRTFTCVNLGSKYARFRRRPDCDRDCEGPHIACGKRLQKILNGAEPADTAVEQIHKTRLDTNMKTARTQGLKIPDSIRLRAEELIE